MTLLEVIASLVILGMSVGAMLQGVQAALRSERDAVAWTRAVAAAESAVAGAVSEPLPGDSLPPGYSRRVEVRPYAGDVVEVVATIGMPDGGRFVLHRLTRVSRRADP
jgi:hypothetical protein